MTQDFIHDILGFWFDEHGFDDWFQKSDAFDQAIRSRFDALWREQAGHVDIPNIKDARTALGLIILLDQFPRNMFRDTPQAFATDTLALKIADHLRLNIGTDLLDMNEYIFASMPYMHSERLSDQNLSVSLFSDTQSHDYAVEHRRLIVEYGRFPHRNSILGRTSTPPENDYLSKPGAGF
mgnify:FL=1